MIAALGLVFVAAVARSPAALSGAPVGLTSRKTTTANWPEVLSNISRKLSATGLSQLSVDDLRRAASYKTSGNDGLSWPVAVWGVCPIQRNLGAHIALLTLASQDRSPTLGCLARFRTEKGRVVGEPLVVSEGQGDLLSPQQAAQVGDRLVVQGLSQWEGNSPRASVLRLQATNNGWTVAARIEAEFESWGTDKLKFSPDGKTILPVKVSSTTMPENLPFCRATSLRSMIEEWDLGEYGPRLKWKHPQETPYNTLDRLFERRQDLLHVGSFCSSTDVAKQLVALADHPEDLADTWFPKGPDANATTIGILNLRTAFHFVRKNGKWVVDRIEPISSDIDSRLPVEERGNSPAKVTPRKGKG